MKDRKQTLKILALIIDLMNDMMYDVAIPGNHEFDYGMQRFLHHAQKPKKDRLTVSAVSAE